MEVRLGLFMTKMRQIRDRLGLESGRGLNLAGFGDGNCWVGLVGNMWVAQGGRRE